jgi:hypothetical protein
MRGSAVSFDAGLFELHKGLTEHAFKALGQGGRLSVFPVTFNFIAALGDHFRRWNVHLSAVGVTERKRDAVPVEIANKRSELGGDFAFDADDPEPASDLDSLDEHRNFGPQATAPVNPPRHCKQKEMNVKKAEKTTTVRTCLITVFVSERASALNYS